jgi:hypothetical protein
MQDFDAKLKEINSKFQKGEISFDEHFEQMLQWSEDFGDIIKAQSTGINQDASHGGKLHQKVVYDKTGKKVTKWVSTEKQSGTSGKGKVANGIETPVKQSEVEKQYTLEQWEQNAPKASDKALEKASKMAGSDDIRRIARNELLKRSFETGKYMNLSLLPDFMLDGYVAKYDSSKVTKSENEAIAAYRDNGYFSLNKKLRNDEELEPDEKKQLKQIDAAIDKSELQHDLTLFRGLNGGDSNGLMFINYLKSLQPGDIYHESSYSSSSILQGQAFKFKDLYNSANNISLKIFAPKGSKALCLQTLGGEDEKNLMTMKFQLN